MHLHPVKPISSGVTIDELNLSGLWYLGAGTDKNISQINMAEMSHVHSVDIETEKANIRDSGRPPSWTLQRRAPSHPSLQSCLLA